ncbi:MAG: hypothetical protein ACO32J_05790 [Phycisphaerales bacterium]|jgi:hypothetical protein
MPVSRTVTRLAMLAVGIIACGCNPTWTKDGEPNQNSMPLPPDATPPAQTTPANGSQPSG